MEVPKMFFPVSAFCLNSNFDQMCALIFVSAWLRDQYLCYASDVAQMFCSFQSQNIFLHPKLFFPICPFIFIQTWTKWMGLHISLPHQIIITGMSTQIFQYSRNSFLSQYTQTCIFYLSRSHRNFYFSDQFQKCLKCSFRTHVTFIWTWTVEKSLFL